MTENMAGRGEGLAGRTMAQIEMRNACFRDMLGLIKACHSYAPENSTGKEALTALYDSIQSQGVEGFGAALEAAAPAGTAFNKEEVDVLVQGFSGDTGWLTAQLNKLLEVKRADQPSRTLGSGDASMSAAALATPSPQAPATTPVDEPKNDDRAYGCYTCGKQGLKKGQRVSLVYCNECDAKHIEEVRRAAPTAQASSEIREAVAQAIADHEFKLDDGIGRPACRCGWVSRDLGEGDRPFKFDPTLFHGDHLTDQIMDALAPSRQGAGGK